jgi:GTPase SAR1 family protein
MFEHRIAVTGLTGAGKTTFITSLLDHWRQHEPSRFELGPNGKAEMTCQWRDAREYCQRLRYGLGSVERIVGLECSGWRFAAVPRFMSQRRQGTARSLLWPSSSAWNANSCEANIGASCAIGVRLRTV